MAKNDSKVNKATQTRVDDFKLIRGIKRGIENQLHRANIQTYAQLAALTPGEILSKLGKVNGYSIRRIEEENWIGQAHTLTPARAQRKSPRKETATPTIRQHYENFTIEFLLDEKNTVRRARVAHVQSGDADTWTDWEGERVFDFISRHAGVCPRYTKSAFPAPQKPSLPPRPPTSIEEFPNVPTESDPIAPVEMTERNSDLLSVFADPSPTAQGLPWEDTQALETVSLSVPASEPGNSSVEKIQLLEWKTSLSNTDQSVRTLPHDQAFNVSLTLDLTKVALPDESKLDCVATLYAKKLGGGNRQMIGETEKTLAFENTLVLTICHLNLAKGIYRLEALVTILRAGTEVEQLPDVTVFLESGPVQVY